MVKKKVPAQGDIIVVNFSPQTGHEQNGTRPAVVISKSYFNKATGLVVVCPITSTKRDFPLHVEITDPRLRTKGYIMCEQVKSIDYVARGGDVKEKLPEETVTYVIDIVSSIINQS